MNGFFIFATLLATVYGQLNPAGCGKRPLVNADKIVGGTTAVPGDWGWQISMLYNGRHICGGSLVNANWIVTAAHCVSGALTPSLYSIDIGLHDRTVKESWFINRRVSNVIMHEQYNANTLRNDIALMKLSTPAAIDNYYIVPVCYQRSSADLSGQTSWATGWGTLFSGGSLSRYNMQVAMPVLTDARCKQRFGANLDPNLGICAGEVGNNKDTCQGDSGGPLVVKNALDGLWYLIGITSWGYGCGDGGVYTRASFYATWVEGKFAAFP
jgi:secreted trypsin-like serine protease